MTHEVDECVIGSKTLLSFLTVTFRVPGPHERGRFAPEAWGHLLALRGSGLLSTVEFEQVIDRVLGQVEGRIALEDIRALLDGVGLDENSGGPSASVH